MKHYEAFGVWEIFGPGVYNGTDQIALYSVRYYILSAVALVFGLVCFVAEAIRRYWAREPWANVRLALELHWFLVFTIYVLPDVVRIPLYSGWVGALALRLTTAAAVMGLSVLAARGPRNCHPVGFGVTAVLLFA